MKKNFKFILLFLLLIPLVKVNALSKDYFNESDSKTEINHSIFRADNTVDNEEIVKGLSFIAGNNVNLNGIYDYGFFAGNNVTVKGTIENDLFIAGNNVTLAKDAIINRDVYAAGSILYLNTNIKGNAFLAGSEIHLSNITISGDLTITADKIVVDKDVTIKGTFKYNENTQIENKNLIKANKTLTYQNNENNNENAFSNFMVSLGIFLILGLGLNLLFPSLTEKLTKKLDAKEVVMTSLKGFVCLLVIPIIILILMCTIAGIELGVFLGLIYILAMMISLVSVSTIVGNLISNKLFKKSNLYLGTVLGIVLLRAIELIPVVGGLIATITLLYGLGLLWNLFIKVR